MIKLSETRKKSIKRRPARTAEERENQLISEAMDAAEERILSGSAPSQLLIHFLRLGTEKYRLEREKLRSDVELSKAKTEQIKAMDDIKELYQEAIGAMKLYSGNSEEMDEFFDE